MKTVAIIGGGAAGCFAAIEIKSRCPDVPVMVYEGGGKPLAKVALTGGGRCNLTNSFEGVTSMETVYPRGARLMKRLFMDFDHNDTCKWFEERGVKLVTQADGCVFPQSQNALQITETLIRLMRKTGVVLKTNHRVEHLTRENDRYKMSFSNGHVAFADIVLAALGGCRKQRLMSIFDKFELEFVETVPSLFSFCIDDGTISSLMGIVIEDVVAGIAGTKMRARGPLLLTHWGMSGPAILRLSSYAARYLYDLKYQAALNINWTGGKTESDAQEMLVTIAEQNRQKMVSSTCPDFLNMRLWRYLLNKAGCRQEMRWAEIGRKGLNKLASTLTSDTYRIVGKNRFKDEFVTCGGVAMTAINNTTLECRTSPGLYFAGEMLDIDAVTGGFNLQAAWTMGYKTANSIIESYL
ncbi:MAG: aminoacetone oxidase family FAD-binding enzyme [Prevotella sp.]